MIVLDQALSFLYEPITTNMLKDKQRKILLQLLLVDRFHKFESSLFNLSRLQPLTKVIPILIDITNACKFLKELIPSNSVDFFSNSLHDFKSTELMSVQDKVSSILRGCNHLHDLYRS